MKTDHVQLAAVNAPAHQAGSSERAEEWGGYRGSANGQVYVWQSSVDEFSGGRLETAVVSLPHLALPVRGLKGRYVGVVNAGLMRSARGNGLEVALPVGNAMPNEWGDFMFDPADGGGLLDAHGPPFPLDPERYMAAGRFGEVNAYYHITRMAEHMDRLLARLGEKSLPPARARINAHVASEGLIHHRDGVRDAGGKYWLPLAGASYLAPQPPDSFHSPEGEPPAGGEIALGPALRSTRTGWLARLSGASYACNPAHIASQIYCKYGHHVTRYTADFRANSLRPPHQQDNAKTNSDCGVADYLAASMLGTPHIFCWHRRHDSLFVHQRSLARSPAATDLEAGNGANVHPSGTVLASALWDLRQRMEDRGDPDCDLLVLAALIEVGRLLSHPYRPRAKDTRRLRAGFPVFAACLLHADRSRFGATHSGSILATLRRREIAFCKKTLRALQEPFVPRLACSLASSSEVRRHAAKVRAECPDVVLPRDEELIHPDLLEHGLRQICNDGYDLVAVGDVMNGMRAEQPIKLHGPDYVFSWTKPILRRAEVVFGNLEGPFAAEAEMESAGRNHTYKVNPKSAALLRRAGFNAMAIANNHLLDCGRSGVRETLAALQEQGIRAFGGGPDEWSARTPAIFASRVGRIGLLGYYWHKRTAACGDLPGSALFDPELVVQDIQRLRAEVDRVVVSMHWGVPYERAVSPENRARAHLLVDCGADLIIGHHPHIIQQAEVYRGVPIFYSVGNFAFGSGNSRGESVLVAVRFLEQRTDVTVFPVYVQNRDPRLNYQPKIMGGEAGSRILRLVAPCSARNGEWLEQQAGHLHVLRSSQGN